MATTADQLRLVATEFADDTAYPDETVELFLDMAANRMNVKAWGTKYDNGQLFLAAHMLRIYADQSAANHGAIQSETVGPLSTSYAAPAPAPVGRDLLASTVWGRMYLDLSAGIFANRMYGF